MRLDGDSSLEVAELDDDKPAPAPALRQRQRARPQPRRAARLRAEHAAGPRAHAASRAACASTPAARRHHRGQRVRRRGAGRRRRLAPDRCAPARAPKCAATTCAPALAVRDSFDDWATLRDQRDDRVPRTRYVTSEMTGYEDLDRYGSWRDDSEYGPLWTPRRVPAGWAPYRDGRWTWVAPWGWTWVDNAPWGYAPFHYGRWVMVNQRWCWAPGRNIGASGVGAGAGRLGRRQRLEPDFNIGAPPPRRRRAGIRCRRATLTCRATACRTTTCAPEPRTRRSAMRGRPRRPRRLPPATA